MSLSWAVLAGRICPDSFVLGPSPLRQPQLIQAKIEPLQGLPVEAWQMALLEEFESTGNFLFRWRSYLPVMLLGLFVGLMPSYYQYPGGLEKLDHLWELFCLMVGFSGLALRAFTIGYTPAGTSGRNTKEQIADHLNTTGIYSIVRNPLYLGNFLMYLSVAMFIHVWWITSLFVLVFWLYYERIIFAEEAYLRGKFGKEYLEWSREVPPFIPRIRGYRNPDLTFSTRNVLKREYNGLVGLVLALFAMESAGEWFLHRHLDFDPHWIITVSLAMAIWLVLRLLKKKTRFLHVDGR